jgi:hypothetical protein
MKFVDVDCYEEEMNNKMNRIKVPAMKMRNPYALDAMTRKADQFRDRREKRRNNPKNNNWEW